MKQNITQLEPRALWQNFHALTQIPRTSTHEQAAIAFVEKYCQEHGLATQRDAAGNLIVRKPASEGKEHCKGVVLQGHIDMVPQKNEGLAFDFEHDAIRTVVDGDYVRAEQTTLGADDGIGIAAALAIMTDPTLVHGPLEMLVTVEEETSMGGAFALEPGLLQSKVMLNLDSEQEGEVVVGCAGGLNIEASFDYQPVETAEEDIAFRVKIAGLSGGHSGLDIHLGRANANKLLTRFLKFAAANYEAMLAQIVGGDMHNAIPREASAVLTIDSDDRDDFLNAVDEFEDLFRSEYATTEPNLTFTAEVVPTPNLVIDEMTADDLINALQACPNGVVRMQHDVPGQVETSLNLSVVRSSFNAIDVIFLVRSSLDSMKEDVASSVQSLFSLAGAKVTTSGDYPGWQPNASSQVLSVVCDEYRRLFSAEPKILSMHAGLECGIIASNYPDLDIVSFGPTIRHPHSPQERVDINSVERFWHLLRSVIERLAE